MPRLWLVLLLGLFVLPVMSCVHAPSPEEHAVAYYGNRPDDHQTVVRRYMQQRLKDPESARYAFTKGPTKTWYRDFNALLFGYGVCVSVNAKNSFGGYVGARDYFFLLQGEKVIHVIEDETRSGVTEGKREACARL